jgi:hypothetical protein
MARIASTQIPLPAERPYRLATGSGRVSEETGPIWHMLGDFRGGPLRIFSISRAHCHSSIYLPNTFLRLPPEKTRFASEPIPDPAAFGKFVGDQLFVEQLLQTCMEQSERQ